MLNDRKRYAYYVIPFIGNLCKLQNYRGRNMLMAFLELVVKIDKDCKMHKISFGSDGSVVILDGMGRYTTLIN